MEWTLEIKIWRGKTHFRKLSGRTILRQRGSWTKPSRELKMAKLPLKTGITQTY